jgi:hypothetical protein
MIIDYSAAAKGYQTRSDDLQRKRQALAEAFETFKRNNPHATYAEYQAFIDQNVGGGSMNNYLRGGIPGDEVLKALAAKNEEAKKTAARRQAIADLEAQGRFIGSLEGKIDERLLNMQGDDFDAEYDNFIGMFGEGAEDMFHGMNLRNYFTPNRRDKVVGQRVFDMQGKAFEYIKNANGKIDDPDQFARMLGVPVAVVKPLIGSATEKYDAWLDQQARALNNDMITLINSELQANRDPNLAIDTFLADRNIDKAKFQKHIDAAKKQAETERKRLEDERNEQAEQLRLTKFNEFRKDFEGDALIINALKSDDQAGAVAKMVERASTSLTDKTFQQVFGVDKATARANPQAIAPFVDMARTIQGGMSEAQRMEQAKNVQELSGSASKLVQGYKEQNAGKAEVIANMFGGKDSPAYGIVQNLASQYDMSYRTLNAIQNVFSNLDAETRKNPAAVRDAILADEEFINSVGGAPNLNQRAQEYASLQIQKQGGFNVESFQNWQQKFMSEGSGIYYQAEQTLNKIANEEDPRIRIQALRKFSSSLNQRTQEIGNRLTLREENHPKWVEYGTGGWDQDAANSMRDMFTKTAQQIQQRVTDLEQQAAAEIKDAPPIDMGPKGIDKPSPTMSPVGRGFVEWVGDMNADEAVGFAINDSGGVPGISHITGWTQQLGEALFDSEVESNRRDEVRVWANEEGRRDRINEFVKLTYHSYGTEAAEKVLNDLATLTAKELQEKYGAALETLGRDRVFEPVYR